MCLDCRLLARKKASTKSARPCSLPTQKIIRKPNRSSTPCVPRSSTKERGCGSPSEIQREESFPVWFSLLLLWRLSANPSQAPFSQLCVCACVLSFRTPGRENEKKKKAEMCRRPWLPVPPIPQVVQLRRSKGKVKTGKKQERKQKRTHVRFGFGCGRWMVQKVRPEKRRVFFSCLVSSIFN